MWWVPAEVARKARSIEGRPESTSARLEQWLVWGEQPPLRLGEPIVRLKEPELLTGAVDVDPVVSDSRDLRPGFGI